MNRKGVNHMTNYPTTELNDLAEQAISLYTQWLNLHEGTELYVRAHYDEYDDPPVILSDIEFPFFFPTRQLTMRVNPAHDEGGPQILMAIFRNYAIADGDPDTWHCDSLVQYFDTYTTVAYANDTFQGVPE